MLIALIVGFAISGRGTTAFATFGIVIVVLFGLPLTLILKERSAEQERRNAGALPSWPAQMPAVCLKTLGGHTNVKPNLAVSGRLFLVMSEWSFRASPQAVRNSATTANVSWLRSAPVQGEKTFGLFSPGVMTFETGPGNRISVECRYVEKILQFERSTRTP